MLIAVNPMWDFHLGLHGIPAYNDPNLSSMYIHLNDSHKVFPIKIIPSDRPRSISDMLIG